MTIKQLKNILDYMDVSKDVFIFDFEKSEMIEIESLSDNNGHLQINIGVEASETNRLLDGLDEI